MVLEDQQSYEEGLSGGGFGHLPCSQKAAGDRSDLIRFPMFPSRQGTGMYWYFHGISVHISMYVNTATSSKKISFLHSHPQPAEEPEESEG